MEDGRFVQPYSHVTRYDLEGGMISGNVAESELFFLGGRFNA